MRTETIQPTDTQHWLELRAADITSTEVGALFGVSPYATEFELWHRKKGREVVSIEENDRMKWGSRLQDAIAFGVAEDNGWQVRRMPEYIRDSELRIGSSFDFEITVTNRDEGQWDKKFQVGLLEIKNVDGLAFRDGWAQNDDGSIEAPPHIEIQVQHQLAVSGRAFAYLAALVGGNRVVLIRREPDEGIISAIRTKVKAFWESIDSNIPPAPNYSLDLETLSRLYGYATPGKVFDARDNGSLHAIVEMYRLGQDEEKRGASTKEAAKAELLTLIGDAEKVLGQTFSITASMVAPARVEYDRGGYRTFRVNWKKGSK